MGGWRKLYFVLQNQLLLSYSSKDDYEKKLAPFKDVVSLVPGTTIRPTKGPRFIIETTTNLMLTYVSKYFGKTLIFRSSKTKLSSADLNPVVIRLTKITRIKLIERNISFEG